MNATQQARIARGPIAVRRIARFATVAFAAAVGIAGCATPFADPTCTATAAPSTPSPLLWRATSPAPGAGVIYLFGSVHVGSTAVPSLSAEVEDAYARSDELVVEVDLNEAAIVELAAGMARLGLLGPDQMLRDLVSGETLEQLARYLERHNVPLASVERMKPWFVTNLLIALELKAAGYDAENGIDRYLLGRVDDKPVRALESAEQQIELFDRLPLPVQVIMLEDALERMDDFLGAMDQMITAWQHGDEATLEDLVFQPVEENSDFEVFYEAIIYSRNQTMSETLAELSRDGRSRFVVLGAGHMLGPRGIPTLLCEAGFEIRRVVGGG